MTSFAVVHQSGMNTLGRPATAVEEAGEALMGDDCLEKRMGPLMAADAGMMGMLKAGS